MRLTSHEWFFVGAAAGYIVGVGVMTLLDWVRKRWSIDGE